MTDAEVAGRHSVVPAGDALAGRTFTVTNVNDTVITHEFGADRLRWVYDADPDDPHGDEQGEDDYEAFRIDEELYAVRFHARVRPTDAVSLFLDLRSGYALSVVTSVQRPDDAPARAALFVEPGTIDEATRDGAGPFPSTALLGRVVRWEHADGVDEHIRLRPDRLVRHGLAGRERGRVEVDEAVLWQLRDGLYVTAWSALDGARSVTALEDHRDASRPTLYGASFGTDVTGDGYALLPWTARGRLVAVIDHPDHLDPAR